MAKLDPEEENLFKRLKAKMEAPEAPAIGRSVQAIVDFTKPESIAAAIKHGFLSDDSKGDEEEDDDKEKDDPPKRKGYFD